MPVESFFLPNESLQGEEIPAHIIWKDIPFSFIKAEIPPHLEVEKVFNVKEGGWKKDSFGFLVKEVEVDGYLGMVLKSHKLDAKTFDVWVDFSFVKEDKVIERVGGKVHLFRPEIVVERVPSVIEVNLERNFVSPRIKMRNSGEGTALVMIRTLKGSQIKKELPQSIQDFREQYYKDLEENLESVKGEFPEHFDTISQFLRISHDSLIKVQTTTKKKYLSNFKEMERILEKMFRIFETDEEFSKAILEALGAAYIKNLKLLNVFDDFLNYFNSISKSRILIPDPISVVLISDEPKELRMEIMTTDLVLSEYPTIKIPKMKVVGSESGELPIYRLFEWR